MGKLTTAEFVKRSNITHNKRYDYSKSLYKNAKTKLIIVCPEHGEFLQEPYSHYSGCGCPKCAKPICSAKDFIKLATKIHEGKYTYDEIGYVDSKTKVSITCKKHGNFFQKPSNHTHLKHGCPSCSQNKKYTNKEFILKANNVHDNKYNYTNTKYTTSYKKVIITCLEHGDFTQSPSHHLLGQGCIKCSKIKAGNSRKLSKEQFISKSKEIHGNRYIYSHVEYVNTLTNVVIYCPEHGDFEQTPGNHTHKTSPQGCPSCGRQGRLNYWSFSEWGEAGAKSKFFDSFKLYVLKCYDTTTGEIFIKVGKTYTTIERRFSGPSKIPYKYEVIKVVEGSSEYISSLEHRFHRKYKKHSYIPNRSFSGHYECFTYTSSNKIELVMPLYYTKKYKTKKDKTFIVNMNWARNANHFLSNEVKKYYHSLVSEQVSDKGIIIGPYKLQMRIYYKNPLSDAGNSIGTIEKYILDGLQESGTIKDDNISHHLGSSWTVIGQDKIAPRVEIELIEICEENK